MAIFEIRYKKHVVRKDIPALSPDVTMRIRHAIEHKLTADPITFGKPLRHGLYGQRRLRVGDYRVIYTIDRDNQQVIIEAIGHRSHIYD